MNYKIYKLDFLTSVHFGDGGLTKASSTLNADTLFSALCIEAVKMGELDTLLDAVNKNELYISDGLPFIGDNYYIPKPLVSLNIERDGDSTLKKAMKKLEYLPIDKVDQYIQGKMDLKHETEYFSRYFGHSSLIEKATIRGQDQTMPYAVQTFTYGKDAGLYIVAAFKDENQQYLLEDLLTSLGLNGIGGKTSSGYGKFELKYGNASKKYLKRLTDDYDTYITLSICLPTDNEMEQALQNSQYKIKKRSGFVESSTYAQSFRKKKDVYLIAAGSSFENKFNGLVLDVSDHGNHPVYRYAKPLFLGVM